MQCRKQTFMTHLYYPFTRMALGPISVGSEKGELHLSGYHGIQWWFIMAVSIPISPVSAQINRKMYL